MSASINLYLRYMKKTLITLLLLSLLAASCKKEEHFISDRQYRDMMNSDLKQKMELLGLDAGFDSILEQMCNSAREREALSFLYAYMPVGDISDYDASLYIEGIRSAFRAQEEMPWGKSVPEEVFRHFVLPLRVNNENLDSARTVFYAELKERVQGLSMYDAVLEVNHWCHEKVIYTPSDIRTSAPLASVRTAYGRCGEESVFTAAALRSVGIPARQVYTPRWAHTDDNHAWVEAWVDGKWYYLGACEPEPKLNVAWFSQTDTRAMLMHAKVFGKYAAGTGEDIIRQTDCITEINVTSNYAPTERVTVAVKDAQGGIVEDALVEFKIYNYAELYSAITSLSDKNGEASGIFGKGDMIIWVSKGDKFGFTKISVGHTQYPAVITLERTKGETFSINTDITPPYQSENDIILTPEEIETNKIRLAREDSIRNTYIATFASDDDLSRLFDEINVKPSKRDKERISRALKAARGNWREIYRFLAELPQERFGIGLDLFDVISEKDLRDTPASVLADHAMNYNHRFTEKDYRIHPQLSSIMKEYLLRPRVGFELLSPWRGYFQQNVRFVNNSVEEIISFVKSIKVVNNYNPQQIPQGPIGVYDLEAGDTDSRNALFVTLCRSMNIPSRIEEVSGKVQYWRDGIWINVNLDSEEGIAIPTQQGALKLHYISNKYIDDPKVDSHFTIADLSNLSVNSLNFRTVDGFEGTMSFKSRFSKPVELDEGYYLLTSGTRMASGKVLVNLTAFNVEADKQTDVNLVMRSDAVDLQVIGNMNVESKYLTVPGKDGKVQTDGKQFTESSILNFTGRGFFVLAFVKATHEPCNHLLRSLYSRAWERPVIIFYEDHNEISLLKGVELPAIPQGVGIGIDTGNKILNEITNNLKLTNWDYPLTIIADSFGNIVYCTQGYNIGTANLLMKNLNIGDGGK